MKEFKFRDISIIVSFFIIFILLILVKGIFTSSESFTNNSNKSKNIEDILFKKKSPHQTIEVTKMHYPIDLGRCLILDNEVQLSTGDEHKYHELMVHFPVYYLSKLKNVLIIGGGDLMNLREVMKYSTIKNVYILELDKEVVSTCKKFFNVSDYKKDPRVKIIYGDAAKTISKIKNLKFDLILLDLTESLPNNLPVGKVNFIKTCRKKLDKNGILVMNGIGNKDKLSSVFKYTKLYGCYLKTFEEYYQYVICSDKDDFKSFSAEKNEWKKVDTKFYKTENHHDFFNWYSFINKVHI